MGKKDETNVAGNGNLPRLLVIGARGFLGSFLTRHSAGSYQVIRGDRTAGSETDLTLDVADQASADAGIDAVRPDAVVLLAAISDIDRCERNPEQATATNVHGAWHVANACARTGARLIFTSTGAIFDGFKHGYVEEDAPTPNSVYGETKAKAEVIVQQCLPAALILRVSLVLGRTGKPGTNSLIDNLARRWQAGETLPASVLEARNPIDAATLSEWILELLEMNDVRGIFHTGSTEAMTRYEMISAIAERLGVPSYRIKAELQSPAGRAPRGLHQLLLSDKISRICKVQPPSCMQAIERSLNEVA